MTRKKRTWRYSEIPEVEAYKIWWEETEGWRRTEGMIKADAAIEALRDEVAVLEDKVQSLYDELAGSDL